ncbi:MAG: sigma-70 family RNA polymerase sigma factor [Terriglobales bacterium]
MWFFRTRISSVTPVRSVTRCAEPTAVGFIPRQIFMSYGNKTTVYWFTLVCVPEESLPSESFEQLAMPHFERLYNFACWLTENRQEAEDLVQETYAKALKGFSSFQPGTNFRAWIYKILRNTFLTSRTGLKATSIVQLDLEGEEETLPAVKETPESILLQRSDGQLVQQALEQLPVAYREILLLCEVEEMSYQEISAALAIPMGTVMSRLSRARKTLRDGLRPRFQKG